MIDIVYVLREAWRIGWRHKRLWVLGFAGSLGVGVTRLAPTSRALWQRAASDLPPDVGQALLRLLDRPYFPFAVGALALAALAVSGAVALLTTVGRAGLVAQVQAAEERGAVSVRAGWQAGRQQLWPVLLLRLALGMPALLAVLGGWAMASLWAMPALSGSYWPGGSLPAQTSARLATLICLVPAMGLLLLASVPLSVLLRLAVCARVLEGAGVPESIRRAATSARRHWGATVLLWLVQLGVTLGAAILFGLPLLFGAAALSLAALATAVLSPLWSIGLTALIGLVGWLGAAAVGGTVETFASAMWTLAYREMHGLGLTGEAASAGPLPYP